MSYLSSFKRNWFSNIRADVLSGLVVALALIPEAIGFSIIAGVDPKIGLYAAFSICAITALLGGRPGMISGATAAVAVLVVPLVRDHGVQYLFAATILMGVLQGIAGLLRLGLLMQYVSRSVITGFVNALAILIFMAQLPELLHVTWQSYAMVGAGLAIIYLFPRLTRIVPSALVSIIVLSIVAVYFGLDVRTVGDKGELPSALPTFLIPDIPFSWETLKIIFPYSLTMAAVGLLESLLTSSIVDDLTDTSSSKNRECFGQGAANFITGFLGGMGGCAMIGQSVINVTSGGRTRLSGLVAGVMLLVLVVFLGPWVRQIPMPALVAVMIMVSINTFKWRSILDLRHHPLTSNIVMIATVAVVVATHDLSQGVIVGVLLSGIFFAQKAARMVTVHSEPSADGEDCRYIVSGEIFFASATRFTAAFDLANPAKRVVIDLTAAHFWDISGVGALDKVVMKMRRQGSEVQVLGLNEASMTMMDRFAIHDKAASAASLPVH
ncbi:MAG: SulP family inorganic anion transporter [Rhodospirillaceae bacterium]|nr:MAG: SulP family inorganic anion transporter [Rhodospirillaceae bacterium]